MTTYRFCRLCDITSPERGHVCAFFDPQCKFKLTTAESHQRDLDIVNGNPWASKWLGVNGGQTGTAGFPNFDIVHGLQPDFLMHCFVTTSQLEWRNFCRIAFKSKASDQYHHQLTLEIFNRALKTFKNWLAKDRGSVPSCQEILAFTKGHNLCWSSAQTIVFVLQSEQLLAEYVDTSDPKWKCWVMKCRYIRTAQKTVWDWAAVQMFEQEIVEHHTLYVALYKVVIPKWHYESHAPLAVLLHANLKEIAAWELETFHRVFKRMAGRLTSHDTMGQLARMFSRRTAIREWRRKCKHAGVDGKLQATLELDWGSDAGQLLARMPIIQEYNDQGAYADAMPSVHYFKHLVHLGEKVRVGDFIVAHTPGPADTAILVILALLVVSDWKFMVCNQYGSGLLHDDLGRYFDISSVDLQQQIFCMATTPLKLLSTKFRSTKVYVNV